MFCKIDSELYKSYRSPVIFSLEYFFLDFEILFISKIKIHNVYVVVHISKGKQTYYRYIYLHIHLLSIQLVLTC